MMKQEYDDAQVSPLLLLVLPSVLILILTIHGGGSLLLLRLPPVIILIPILTTHGGGLSFSLRLLSHTHPLSSYDRAHFYFYLDFYLFSFSFLVLAALAGLPRSGVPPTMLAVKPPGEGEAELRWGGSDGSTAGDSWTY